MAPWTNTPGHQLSTSAARREPAGVWLGDHLWGKLPRNIKAYQSVLTSPLAPYALALQCWTEAPGNCIQVLSVVLQVMLHLALPVVQRAFPCIICSKAGVWAGSFPAVLLWPTVLKLRKPKCCHKLPSPALSHGPETSWKTPASPTPPGFLQIASSSCWEKGAFPAFFFPHYIQVYVNCVWLASCGLETLLTVFSKEAMRKEPGNSGGEARI